MASSPSVGSFKAGLPDYFLIGLLLFILAEIVEVLLPFSGALLLSAVIGIIFYPFHIRLSRSLSKRSPTAQAFITDGLVLLFFVVPLVLLVWVILNEAQDLVPAVKQWHATVQNFREGGTDSIAALRNVRQWLAANLGVQPEMFREKIGGIADSLLETLSMSAAGFAKNSLSVVIDLFVLVFSLFFIFRDGPEMVQSFLEYIPLRTRLKEQIAQKIKGTLVGVMRGLFLTCLVQGFTASIGYLLAGVPAVALLGFFTALASLIPSVGTALVWLPLGLFYILKHAYFQGGFILAWGALVVGVLDNLARPFFISEKSDLPFLALFFALLGGIEVWGFKGILIGPIVMAILPVLLDAYRQRYLTEDETAEHPIAKHK